ncbi:MAG: T9SS type A sorting domain-containing protein [Bacteroidetes bacterium]|nr:T9SS type A sorting domain-containing protein [Bacteroidota bacterium]
MNKQKLNQRQQIKAIWLLKVGFVAVASLGIVIALLLQFFNANKSRANTNVVEWVGAVSNDWQLDANWKDGSKPDKADIVVIQAGNFQPVVSRNISKHFSRIKIKNGAKLTLQAQLLVDGDLEIESGGNLLIQKGYLEIENNLILQKNGRLTQQDGEIKVKGDYTLYGGIVHLINGTVKVRNDLEIEGNNGEFVVDGGEIQISGDLDCIVGSGNSAFTQNNGNVLVAGNMRFYKLTENEVGNGNIVVNGGELKAKSIARKGQDVSFAHLNANIHQNGGTLIFTGDLTLNEKAELAQSAGSVQFLNNVEIMDFFTFKKVEFGAKAELSQRLKIEEYLKLNNNCKVLGSSLAIGHELEKCQIISQNASINQLEIIGKGVHFAGYCVIEHSISVNGVVSGSVKDKIVISSNAKCDFNKGYCSNMKIEKQGGGKFQVPLIASAKERFLELNADGDIEIKHEILSINHVETDKTFTGFAQSSAWVLQNSQMQKGLLVNNIPQDLVLIGFVNNKWTALTDVSQRSIGLSSEIKEIGYGFPVSLNGALTNSKVEEVNGNPHLEWSLAKTIGNIPVELISIKKWNGFEFVEIALLSIDESEYTEQLVNAEAGTKYRIDLLDKNGFTAKGNVLTLQLSTQNKLLAGIQSVYPSPFNNSFTIQFNAKNDSEIEVQLVDLTGKVITAKQQNVVNGNNAIAINNLSQLQQGNYILRVKSGEQFYSQSVAKR